MIGAQAYDPGSLRGTMTKWPVAMMEVMGNGSLMASRCGRAPGMRHDKGH